MEIPATYTAFAGWKRIVSGSLEEMLREASAYLNSGGAGKEPLLIFHDQTGQQIDFDFRGSVQEILDRAAPKTVHVGPGRPRLGVTSREVSLLPRHWDWLESQSGGASAALRRLVEEARKRNPDEGEMRAAIEATGRFMTVLAGNLPDFEEAYRALYARDSARLAKFTRGWPADVRSYVLTRSDRVPADQPF